MHTTGKVEILNAELEDIFESSFDEIFVTDKNGIVVRMNSACEQHYHLTAQEIIGKHVKELEEMELFYPSATLKVIECKNPIELFQKARDGRYLHVRARPLFDKQGNLFRVVSFSRDLTEMMSLRKRIEEMEGKLESYKREFSNSFEVEGIVSKSESMKQVCSLVQKVAKVDTTVLVLGETGVGKSFIVKALHNLSNRKDKPLNEVNCAALPENLIESELFGFEGGSFTGAAREGRKGLIETTNGGTLFLDEIGELPLHLQAKLLHVLQEKKVRPIGGKSNISVNVRFIAATNKVLEEMVSKGTFREDLYYRLNVVPITIPPLRERQEDVLPLVHHFLDHFKKLYNKNVQFSPKALATLLDSNWEGNIRAVENMVERLVVTTDNSEITVRDLPPELNKSPINISGKKLKQVLGEVEKNLIQGSYEKHQSTYKVAEELGISQSAAMRKVKKYYQGQNEQN